MNQINLTDFKFSVENKITIVEGPDYVGKTTFVKSIVDTLGKSHPNLDVRVIRCPDNHDDATIRDVIMSNKVKEVPQSQAFLFMADFVLTYESKIKPFVDDPNVIFIMDRFIPSTCVYQKWTVTQMNDALYESLKDAFSQAVYLYMHPEDLDAHRARMSKRSLADVNHLDPKNDEQMIEQIERYERIRNAQLRSCNGILGSKRVTVLTV